MKHLIRFAAVMAAAAFLALPLGAQSHGGRHTGHGSSSNSSYSGSSSSRSGMSSSHASGSRSTAPATSLGSTPRSVGSTRSSGDVNRPNNGGNRPSGGSVNRPNNGGNRPPGHNRPNPGARPFADGNRPAPGHMGRVHINDRPGHNPPRPRHHELHGDPARFSHYGRHHYGHYVTVLPPYYVHRVYHGRDYYYWNDVWYRYYAGRYWVCRPPFGYVFTPLADVVLAAIVYNALTDDVDEVRTVEANSLNLIRNYAAPGTEYFYNDGVFFVKGEDGQYVVIVPPAGAMVDALPEDFEEFEFDGNTYYKVDDTVYRMTVSEEGKACFEVLGQLAD